MRIYISGKITGDPNYKEKFEKAEKYIESLGHIPINPAKLSEVMPKDAEYIEYMEICAKLIKFSDAVYFLADFMDSKGASYEFTLTRHLNKKTLLEKSELVY